MSPSTEVGMPAGASSAHHAAAPTAAAAIGKAKPLSRFMAFSISASASGPISCSMNWRCSAVGSGARVAEEAAAARAVARLSSAAVALGAVVASRDAPVTAAVPTPARHRPEFPRRLWPDTEMVTVAGGVGHGVYGSSTAPSRAPDKTATTYLTTGELPAKDVTCKAAPAADERNNPDRLPLPTPPGVARMVSPF
ncbi:hypothetical protein DD630_16910 [Streptomyces sp. BSE7F]|nr:hypothetical protein DD630_16910 [Streptomyces sp. BSE7F]